MPLKWENNIKNRDFIDLSKYENNKENSEFIVINSDIEKITITSRGESCNYAIFIRERNKDLVINIEDLNINSKEKIAIDFSAGINYNYKNYLLYSGINNIESNENIGICITNNNTVEIRGEEAAILNITAGDGNPAIGNNYYSSGNGHLIFSNKGNIVTKIRRGENNITRETKDGAYAIGFYNEGIEEESSIEILDDVNIEIIGENGYDISSIKLDNRAGNGGEAIYIKNKGSFIKSGNGELEIKSGIGGSCIGNYQSGIPGRGASVIFINSGIIKIKNPAQLIAGEGGSVKGESSVIRTEGAIGGSGGSIIESSSENGDDELYIEIEDEVKIIPGDGGNGGFLIKEGNVYGASGGDGGNFFNLKSVKIDAYIGEIKFTVSKGGHGGITKNKINNGKYGNYGNYYRDERVKRLEIIKELTFKELNLEDEKVEEVEELESSLNIDEETNNRGFNEGIEEKNYISCENNELILVDKEDTLDSELKDRVEDKLEIIEKNKANKELLVESKKSIFSKILNIFKQ